MRGDKCPSGAARAHSKQDIPDVLHHYEICYFQFLNRPEKWCTRRTGIDMLTK